MRTWTGWRATSRGCGSGEGSSWGHGERGVGWGRGTGSGYRALGIGKRGEGLRRAAADNRQTGVSSGFGRAS